MVNPLIIGAASALGRNFVGWAKNSFEDGELQSVEFKKLGVSSLVSLVIYFATYYGLGLAIDTNVEWISMGVNLLLTPIFDKMAFKSLKLK